MKNINSIFRTSLLFTIILAFIGCGEDLVYDKEDTKAPVIKDFSPKTGPAGSIITITGENLQNADSIWIGGELAEIKHRISPTECTALVTAKSKTGIITLAGNNGKTETSEIFTVQYLIPSLSVFPTTAKPNQEIYMEGTNLDAVSEVIFGSTAGTIIAQTKNDIVVQVPFFEDDNVDITLMCNSVEGTKMEISTSGKPFSLEKVKPEVTEAPSEGEKGTMITLKGANLSLVDEVKFGQYKGTINLKENELITVFIPSEFTSTENIELKLIYNGTKEIIVNSAFKVIVPTGPTILYWENKTIYAQDPSNTNNFFNATTGEVYSPCEYAGVKNDIYFFITYSSSNVAIQLNNPNNSKSQTKNFKCDGTALPEEVMPNIVKFKKLNSSIEAEKAYIEVVKNKLLEKITPQDILDAGISNANTNAPRFYGDGLTNNQMNPGDVLLMQQFDASGTVVTRVGFIEIIGFTFSGNSSSMSFNCYFQN